MISQLFANISNERHLIQGHAKHVIQLAIYIRYVTEKMITIKGK